MVALLCWPCWVTLGHVGLLVKKRLGLCSQAA